MKFVSSEKCGPYLVYVSGEEGKKVQAQIFQGDKIHVEKTVMTRQEAECWVKTNIDSLRTPVEKPRWRR